MRIEVGRGLEPQLTDLMTKLIVENAILPAFRRNDFPGGIKAGVRDIRDVLLGDAEEVKQRARAGSQARAGQRQLDARGDPRDPDPVRHRGRLDAIAADRASRPRRPRSPPRRLRPLGQQRRRLGQRRLERRLVAAVAGGGGGGFSGGGGDFGGGGSSGSW